MPSIEQIGEAHGRLAAHVRHTPVISGLMPELGFGPGSRVSFKLELFQHTGSFKARGALDAVMALDADAKAKGVVAVSAGNHAIAASFAAQRAGSTAKVVMMTNANPLRVERCRQFGAEIELADDVHQAFDRADAIARDEGRTMLHPFESPHMVMGSAMLGWEFARDLPDLDCVIVPIGGGGLAAGLAHAVKQLNPSCRIIGVEPTGADSMSRSLAAGDPQRLGKVQTIADSLGAPFALPLTFDYCRRHIDEIVLVSDQEMRSAMGLLLKNLKLAVEPAGAAATAALLGPLDQKLDGLHVGVIVCGANIDPLSFAALLQP